MQLARQLSASRPSCRRCWRVEALEVPRQSRQRHRLAALRRPSKPRRRCTKAVRAPSLPRRQLVITQAMQGSGHDRRALEGAGQDKAVEPGPQGMDQVALLVATVNLVTTPRPVGGGWRRELRASRWSSGHHHQRVGEAPTPILTRSTGVGGAVRDRGLDAAARARAPGAGRDPPAPGGGLCRSASGGLQRSAAGTTSAVAVADADERGPGPSLATKAAVPPPPWPAKCWPAHAQPPPRVEPCHRKSSSSPVRPIGQSPAARAGGPGYYCVGQPAAEPLASFVARWSIRTAAFSAWPWPWTRSATAPPLVLQQLNRLRAEGAGALACSPDASTGTLVAAFFRRAGAPPVVTERAAGNRLALVQTIELEQLLAELRASSPTS